jgi:hypothetical protein
MALRLALIASVVAGGLIAASAAEASPASTTASLNVRAGAGTNFPAVGVLPPNTQVDVQFCPSNWCQITTAYGLSGWVSSRYLNFGPGGFQAGPPTYYPPSQGYYPPPPPPPAPYYPPAGYYPPPPPYGGQCWHPDYGYCDAYFNDQAWWYYNGGYHPRPRSSVSFSIGFRG